MTTKAAAALYEAQHIYAHEGRPVAVFNPHSHPLSELPVIYGFNNGGDCCFLGAVLIAEDGTGLGGHACSSEAYMPADLGILEGTRPDRHETFREHYPDGYRMEFVGAAKVKAHPGLMDAYRRNQTAAEINSLREALWSYVKAQSRMLERWSQSDIDVQARLWADLHLCEEPARAILPAPAPEPTDA